MQRNRRVLFSVGLCSLVLGDLACSDTFTRENEPTAKSEQQVGFGDYDTTNHYNVVPELYREVE